MRFSISILLASALMAACAPAQDVAQRAPSDQAASGTSLPADTLDAVDAFAACERVTLGAPGSVSLDFGGALIVADGSPPRLAAWSPATDNCVEFQSPPDRPAFRPSDAAVRGFFVYAVDEANRLLLRWDSSGSFRDVLLNFEDLAVRRRVSPSGLDVDASGRVAVTDIENHQIIILDSYLNVDVAFGNYGTFAGQLDTPLGVSFTPRGDLLVCDTGNARLQIFSDAGAHRRVIPADAGDSRFRRPRRATAAEDGRIYVADPQAARVFELSAEGLVLRALVPADPGRFEPVDVALTRDGTLYVADLARRAILSFQVM